MWKTVRCACCGNSYMGLVDSYGEPIASYGSNKRPAHCDACRNAHCSPRFPCAVVSE